jgi:hypothetical protein
MFTLLAPFAPSFEGSFEGSLEGPCPLSLRLYRFSKMKRGLR